MDKIRCSLALAALALAGAVSSAQAPVLPAPAVTVELAAPPVPLIAMPPRPAPPVVTAVRVPTVADFVSSFRPAETGGRYETVLMHPCTGCPVKVCFHLPCGCPKKIRCVKSGFEVRYGLCKAVTVRFLADGSVRVRD